MLAQKHASCQKPTEAGRTHANMAWRVPTRTVWAPNLGSGVRSIELEIHKERHSHHRYLTSCARTATLQNGPQTRTKERFDHRVNCRFSLFCTTTKPRIVNGELTRRCRNDAGAHPEALAMLWLWSSTQRVCFHFLASHLHFSPPREPDSLMSVLVNGPGRDVAVDG